MAHPFMLAGDGDLNVTLPLVGWDAHIPPKNAEKLVGR